MHPLDRPIWSALTTRQAGLASGDGLAQLFPRDASPFAASQDASPAALAALAALLPEGDEFSLVERAFPAPPAGIECAFTAPCLQMTATGLAGGGRALEFEALDEADAAEMFALAVLTRPGPYRARTHTLGRFIGVRENGRLVAMAGERLHLDGFHEISAVCTHPDYRGRGYGAALIRAVGARILHEGETPFLHTYANNEPAIALYASLGFSVRAEIRQFVWRRA